MASYGLFWMYTFLLVLEKLYLVSITSARQVCINNFRKQGIYFNFVNYTFNLLSIVSCHIKTVYKATVYQAIVYFTVQKLSSLS